jgi:sugar fermentation stimulation protein A
VEVKGVTLEENGYARFPDAPTERGVKHLEELIACRAEGYETAVCFVLQMSGMREFAPNDDTHPAFGAALRRAAAADVQILARECMVTPDSMTIAGAVPVRL